MYELKRIGIIKRASALLLDIILLAVLTTGFMWIIGLICGFDKAQSTARAYSEEWNEFRKEYFGDKKDNDGNIIEQGLASYYGYTYEETDADGKDFTLKDKDGKLADFVVLIKMLDETKGNDPATAHIYEKYKSLIAPQIVNAQYQYVYSLLFMMLSIGALFAYAVLEFGIPLFFKNGQTIGKKVFSICVVRSNGVKISILGLFLRTFVGKFAIETMFPLLLVYMFLYQGGGLIMAVVLLVFIILNLSLSLFTKNKTPIHDLLGDTVTADMQQQVIFETEEELVKAKTLQNMEAVKNSKS